MKSFKKLVRVILVYLNKKKKKRIVEKENKNSLSKYKDVFSSTILNRMTRFGINEDIMQNILQSSGQQGKIYLFKKMSM